MDKIIQKLSPIERKILPYLKGGIKEIQEKSGLDNTTIIRALKFLENKEILKIRTSEIQIVELGTNGVYYKKKHLPERQLLCILESKTMPKLEEAKKLSKLSDNEFKAALGVLKSKAMIELLNGKIKLNASKIELSKKFPEEQFLEELPLELTKLRDIQQYAFNNLKKRKEIIEVKPRKTISYKLTPLGESIAGKEIKLNLVEEITPAIIRKWKSSDKLRAYDIQASVPKLYAGKRHFVNQSIENAKKIWTDLGFKEMTGNKVQTSFWNFDALFTPQDHPARELHDSFFIKDIEGKLPDKKIVNRVKEAHEKGVAKSKGWNYNWEEDEAKKILLRTHTTCLSAQTLAKLKKSELPAKYFTIGKNFRNETVDWSHGFEFNQTEGIVIDPDANFCNLIGYLKEFAEKMGFKNIRIQPAYFPYTEPSLEGAVWVEEKQQWVEVLAAGVFRPEVVVPLLGEYVPVLAWGPGFDRLMMMANEIKDMRDIYKNDIKQLREKKAQIQ